MVALQSTITCPQCGHRQTAAMPTDCCVYVFECAACRHVMKPKQGQCCVFCSYGDTPCPPEQSDDPRE